MKARGFTLIEVLVASLILFLAIGLAVMSFRSSLQVREAALEQVRMAKVLPVIIDQIEYSLRQSEISEHGREGAIQGIRFWWKAVPKEQFSPPVTFNMETGDDTTHPVKFALYDVTGEIMLNNQKRPFSYSKLGWNNNGN